MLWHFKEVKFSLANRYLRIAVVFLSVFLALGVGELANKFKSSLPANCQFHTHPTSYGLTGNYQGYKLLLQNSSGKIVSKNETINFSILDPDNKVLNHFTVVHEKLLHAFIVGANYSYYYHIHPIFKDGYWQATLPQSLNGKARLIVDFTPLGKKTNTVLGVVINFTGSNPTWSLPQPTDTIINSDFTYKILGGLSTTSANSLVITVKNSKGEAVHLERYLGVLGHAIAFNISNGRYYHFHSMSEKAMSLCPTYASAIKDLWLESDAKEGMIHLMSDINKPGKYLVYLQFQSKKLVYTLPFTIYVS